MAENRLFSHLWESSLHHHSTMTLIVLIILSPFNWTCSTLWLLGRSLHPSRDPILGVDISLPYCLTRATYGNALYGYHILSRKGNLLMSCLLDWLTKRICCHNIFFYIFGVFQRYVKIWHDPDSSRLGASPHCFCLQPLIFSISL